jgi:hypothetical protein
MTTSRKTRRVGSEGSLLGRLTSWLDGGGRVDAIEGGSDLAERSRSLGELARETRGAMFVEYVALLCLVTVGGAAAVVTLGAPLVALARFTQLVVGLPIP